MSAAERFPWATILPFEGKEPQIATDRAGLDPSGSVTWLRFPQKVVPGNAMPDMNLSEEDARDIAAYLSTLR